MTSLVEAIEVEVAGFRASHPHARLQRVRITKAGFAGLLCVQPMSRSFGRCPWYELLVHPDDAKDLRVPGLCVFHDRT